jgi:predicted O-methyltransferase YrrM
MISGQMEKIYEYAENYSTEEPEILRKLSRETHLTQVYPQMLSGHLQGLLLRMIVGMVKPRRILEIGTFTGYSALAMALGADKDAGLNHDADFHLHTIEVNPEMESGIWKYIHEAGLENSITLHIGEAMKIIPRLNETWDLVFIDADKPNYLNYYRMVLPNVRPGGFILVDNVLWDGKVLDPSEKMDKDTRGIVAFNEYIQRDRQVENLLLPLRDGLMLVKKGSEVAR